MSAFQIIPFVAYIAVASPATYKATRGVLGNWVASADGLATLKGVALHAVVFVLLATLLMRFVLPRVSGYAHMMGKSQDQTLPDLMGSPLQGVSGVTNA
jgi:hypothetical protein